MASVRRAQVRLLGWPIARAIRWGPFLGAAPVVIAALVAGRFADPPIVLANVPAVSMLLAACMGFVLDDPAGNTTGSSPTPLLAIRAMRVGVAFIPVLACWGLTLAWTDLGWVSMSLTAGFVAECAVALGAAAVGVVLVGRTKAGLVGAIVVVLVFVVLPQAFEVSLRLAPSSTTWGHLYGRWLLVAGLGLVVFAAASSAPVSRGDMASRRPSLARPARAHAGLR